MEYLHAQGLHTTYAAMRTELASDHQPNPKSKFSDLLEKKWTAVIRLQKKVRDDLHESWIRTSRLYIVGTGA